jgi:signal transduction histidine kinase
VLLNKTLRSSTLKLAFFYVIGFSSAIFFVLGFVYWSTVAYVGAEADRTIATEHASLRKTWAASGRGGLIELIERRRVDPFFADWAYLFADPSRRPLAGNLAQWPAALRGDAGWADLEQLAGAPRGFAGSPLRAIYKTLPDGFHLLVGRKADALGHLRKMIAIAVGSAAGLFLLLAAAAGISTARRSVSRIETINATSRRIIESGLHERIAVRGTRDEWDELAQNLNSMLDRIEELVESNRQVSDNVAHDLRTPLTRMRGRLERAYQRPLGRAQYHALIGSVIAELDAILQTFAALLRIAQIEARERLSGFAKVDLCAIVREVVELFDPAAEASRVRLRHAAAGEAVIVGDRDLLFDALSNLVDNAIKHGGAEGELTVAVAPAAAGPILAVTDRGPGIPSEERKYVLRRFYRLERSRNRPGNGLGLSLVAAVAKLHGARIEMTDNAPGLRIALCFPPASAA